MGGARIGLAAVATALALAGCTAGGGDPVPTSGAAPATTVAERPATVKVVVELPDTRSPHQETRSIVRAVELYLAEHGKRAGPFDVELEIHDATSAALILVDETTCFHHVVRNVEDEKVVGVIGPFYSGCARVEVARANEASLAYVSPSNTAVGLTRKGPGSLPGEPDKHYPSGVRTYARVVPPDDIQGRIGPEYMKDLGVARVYVLDDGDDYGIGVADAFEAEAGEIGLEVAGRASWDASAANYRALMRRVKASGADGVYIGGISDFNGGRVIQDKVAIVGDNEAVKLMVSDGFVVEYFLEHEIEADVVEGAYGSAPIVSPEQLTGAGAEFVAAYERRHGPPGLYAAYGAAAAEVLLDAIARSDGTRADVVAKLFETNIPDGILGPTSFDQNGDLVDPAVAILRAESGAWAPLDVVRPSDFGGSR